MTCGFEKDLSLALQEGRWPAACDPALKLHVPACSSCSDLVLVTSTLQTARARTAQNAVLPAPGLLWWRAQLRRRSGAVERMSRPIVFAEVAAFVATVIVFAIACWRVALSLSASYSDQPLQPDSHFSFAGIYTAVRGMFSSLPDALAGMPGWVPTILAVGVILLLGLGGIAVYALAHNE